jgi:cysteine-rich repeat protein
MCLREFCGDGYMDSDGPGNAPGMNGVDDDRDGSTDEWDELPSSLGVDDDGDELIDEADEHRLWGDDEQCDDGWKNSDVTADACRTDCSNPRCGDGVKDAGEQCDDGNAKDGDGCSSLCAREGCGDFVVQEELGEQCDFGGRKNGDPAASPCSIGDPGVGVSFSCLPVSLDGDSCDAKCQWEQSPLDPSRKERLCGNGVIDPGEQCDTSSMCVVGATPTTPCSSHADCSLGPCVLDQPGGDYVCAKDVVIHCDDGGLPDESLCARLCRPCTAACTFAVTLCGDGNADAGEECDDGNDVSGDGCTFCQLDRRDLCGNGVVDPGEQCDGGAIRTLECTSSCQLPHPPPVCGDGKVESNQTFADRMREILDLREGVLGERGFSLGYQLPGTGEEQPGWFVLPARPGGACSTPTEAAMSGLCRDAREEVSTSQCGNGVIDPGEECDDGRLGVVSFSRPKYNGFQWWRMLFGKTFILHSSTPFYEWYFKLLPYEPYNWQESLWHPWYWPYRTGAWGNWYKNWFYWSGSVPRLKDLLWTTPDQTACSQQCTLVRCGNGRIDLSEECDDPKSSLCSENCQLKNGDPTGGECGDGVINWWNDEECDNGGTCVLKFTTEAPSSSALPTVSFLDVACTTVSSCTCPSTIPGTRCKVVQSCAPRNFDGCDKNCEIESYGDEPDQEEDNYTDCGDGAVNPHDEECEPSGWCGGMIPEDDTNGSVYPNAVGCTKKNQAWICDPTINPVSKGSDCDFSKDEHCSTSCRILGSLVPSCGNGALEPWIGEGCDDGKHCLDHYGNNVNCSKSTSSCAVPSSCITIGGDGCNEACKNEKCGNGIQEMFEQCDFGLLNSDNLPSTCRGSCIFSSCGDMVTDWGEECDDGVTYTCIDGAACTPGSPCPDGSLCTDWGLDGCWFCLSTLCGNGILDFAESCDDGNRSDADDCSRWCLKKHPTDPKMGICGDGVVAGAEECDDGNIVSEDGCSGMDVKKENGDPYPCKVEKCGDGIVQEGLGEECDAGPKNSWSPDAPCRENCTLPRCGDIDPSSNKPIRDGKRGEGCDDGRQCLSGPHSGSLCFDDRDCLEDLGPCAIAPLAEQGRCTLDASRTCSDGDDCMREHPCDLRDGDGCSRACLIETGWKAMVGGGVEKSCGDGVIDPGDECDDGNTSSGDGCSKECLLEYPELCGDGVIDANISEQCDDSNAVSRDGCSATCQRELVRCRGDCADNDAFSCGGGKPCSDQTNRTCDQGTPSNPSDDTSCVFNPSCAFSCRIGFCGNGQIDAGEECDQGDSGDNVCTRFCEAVLASESGSVLRIDSSTSRGRVGVEEVMEAGRELLELQGGGPFGETRSVDNWSLYPFGSWRPWSRLARRPLDQDGGYPRWMGPHASPFPNTVGGHLRKIVQSFQSLRTTDVIPDRTPLFPLEPIGISSFSACQETRPVLTPVTEIPSSPSLTLPPVLPGQVVAEIERLLCSESGTPRMPFSFLCNRAEEQSRAFMLSSIPVMLGLTLQEEAETTKLRERILLQSEEIGAFLGGMAMQEFMGSVLSALSQQIQATTDLFKELGRIAFTTELCPFSGELCKP